MENYDIKQQTIKALTSLRGSAVDLRIAAAKSTVSDEAAPIKLR